MLSVLLIKIISKYPAFMRLLVRFEMFYTLPLE